MTTIKTVKATQAIKGTVQTSVELSATEGKPDTHKLRILRVATDTTGGSSSYLSRLHRLRTHYSTDPERKPHE